MSSRSATDALVEALELAADLLGGKEALGSILLRAEEAAWTARGAPASGSAGG